MLRRLIAILTILIFPHISQAEYVVNENCIKAWQALLDLKITTAKKILDKELKENPKNYYAYYLDQTCDAYTLAINASEKDCDAFSKNFGRRRYIMDGKDTDSPYYLACESEMYLQMAILNIFNGDRLNGAQEAFKAYKALYRNVELFPDFALNKKLNGFFNVAIANLPPFAQSVAVNFGVKGNAKDGMRFLNEYFAEVKEYVGINAEAALFITLAYKLNKEPLKAYQFIQRQDSTLFDYRLINYFRSNTAYRSGNNEDAYNILMKFDLQGSEVPFISYDYLMGKILLRRLDKNAVDYLERFLDQTSRDNYLKEINFKLATFYLVNDNKLKFESFKEVSGESGDDLTERDREAMYDYELDYIPDNVLTKTRLLFDGGYFGRGGELLNSFDLDNDTFYPYKLEFLLLTGRYTEHTANFKKAIRNYKEVIEYGRDEYYYFASEAALRIGFIYLKTDRQKAKDYFEMARDLYESDYYQYIDDIARRELLLLEK